MQNYFKDTQKVLDTTEHLLRYEVLANQTSLIENDNFFNLDNCSVYEIAVNLYDRSHEAMYEYLEEECNFNEVMKTVENYDYQNIKTIKKIPVNILSDVADDMCFEGKVKEPLEWWLVTERLHKDLTNLGFVTLETDWGYYWGRITSGQAIELDNVIQDVARSIHNEKRQNS